MYLKINVLQNLPLMLKNTKYKKLFIFFLIEIKALLTILHLDTFECVFFYLSSYKFVRIIFYFYLDDCLHMHSKYLQCK